MLTAQPGAGKSTLVPPFLLGEPWLAGQRIVMLEPRRLAAAAVAARIAELLGERPGGTAGYRVRGASVVSGRTRIEVVTEALLTRAIQADPLLAGVGLVIFDEFHERSVHADLALALALEVRRARPGLALLVMSATMETGRVAALLGGQAPAPVLECPGSVFPVQTRYQPLDGAGRRWEEGFAAGCARLLDESGGDVLAFVPGAAEIRRVGAALAARLGDRGEVLGLHGSMGLEDQQEVIRPSPAAHHRRVILATSIAETSLTVPGVRAVADSGLARLARFHPATGLDRLVTEMESRSSADQRRGRAGRLGPGTCTRFWKESERLVAEPDPEILRSDLAGVVLECALWGTDDAADLAWLDPPPAASWGQAAETLRMLGLLEGGRVTALGRRAAELGLAPRLAALVLEGIERGVPSLAAACAALLAERDGSGIPADPDFRLRLEMLRTGAGGRDTWRRAARGEAERLLRRAGVHAAPGSLFAWSVEQEAGVGDLLAHAFPDRIARRESEDAWLFVTGRAARFPASAGPAAAGSPPVSRAAAEWITAPDTDAGESIGTIRLAAPVDPAEAARVLAPVTEERLEIRWEGLEPRAVRSTRAGRLLLSERPCRVPAAEGTASFLERLSRSGVGMLPWDPACRGFLERLRFYASRHAGGGLGDLSDAGLAARAGEWLAPHLDFSRGPALGPRGLLAALAGLLDLAQPRVGRRGFDEAVPASLALPLGSRRPIDYSSGSPVVEARIQEVYGLSASPRICGQPLAFRLLSPAGRPLQVTADLAGFWKGSYAEVRKQMRGRYPKHHWPEDPAAAAPSAGPRRRPRA